MMLEGTSPTALRYAHYLLSHGVIHWGNICNGPWINLEVSSQAMSDTQLDSELSEAGQFNQVKNPGGW